MIVGIAALAIPFVATSAASSSADRLIATPKVVTVDAFILRGVKPIVTSAQRLKLRANPTLIPAATMTPASSAPAGAPPYLAAQPTPTQTVVPAATPTPKPTPAPTLAPTSTPSPFIAQLFGVTSFPEWFGLSDNTTDFDRLAAAGMRLVRFDVRWADMEPTTKGTYDPAFFGRLDQIMNLANARGITLILCFDKTPAWARGGTGTEDTPPTKRQDYADALGVLAAHYADRPGMIYEIWNEPNYVGFWTTGVNAAEYTDMLQRAYIAAKAADPDATIVAGSLNHNDPAFLAGMYAAGAHGYFDAFSLHPYTDGRAIDDTLSAMFSFRPQIEGLRAALLAHGDDVPIWLTEFGYTVAPTDYKPVTEAFRAANLATAVSYVRSYSYVRGMAAFTLNTLNGAGYGLTLHKGAVTSSWTSYANAVLGK